MAHVIFIAEITAPVRCSDSLSLCASLCARSVVHLLQNVHSVGFELVRLSV